MNINNLDFFDSGSGGVFPPSKCCSDFCNDVKLCIDPEAFFISRQNVSFVIPPTNALTILPVFTYTIIKGGTYYINFESDFEVNVSSDYEGRFIAQYRLKVNGTNIPNTQREIKTRLVPSAIAAKPTDITQKCSLNRAVVLVAGDVLEVEYNAVFDVDYPAPINPLFNVTAGSFGVEKKYI